MCFLHLLTFKTPIFKIKRFGSESGKINIKEFHLTDNLTLPY